MATPRKLSHLDKRTIRVLAQTHSQAAIAAAYDVAQPTISYALRTQRVAPGRGYRKVRASVSPVAKFVATARVLLGK